MTPDGWSGLDPPAAALEVLADGFGDAAALVLIELTAHAADQVEALRQAHTNGQAEIVVRG